MPPLRAMSSPATGTKAPGFQKINADEFKQKLSEKRDRLELELVETKKLIAMIDSTDGAEQLLTLARNLVDF